LRILHVVHQYSPEFTGGTEIYTQTLASAQVGNGHQVNVFYRSFQAGRSAGHRVENDIGVWWAGDQQIGPARRFLATLRDPALVDAFKQTLQQTAPELVHIQHMMGLPLDLLDIIEQRGVPYVVTLHDYWWVCANAQLLTNYSHKICDGPALCANCARCALARIGAPALWPAIPGLAAALARRRQLLGRVLHRASGLIAPSRFVKDWYAAHGFPAERISVVPHGIDVPAQQPRRSRRTDDPVRFAVIGGLAWQKGLHVALEAFRQVQAPAELWIAGDESAAPEYTRQLRAQAPAGVRFLGSLTHGQVWETLGQIDVLLVPSLWHETFSLIAHEALAAGIPVVVSNAGALTEAVRDGVNGVLVPPGEVDAWRRALERLAGDPGRIAGLNGDDRRPISVAEHVARIEDVYIQSIAKAR
jgi:glycosyltransferase involved in cell wall biosynthesis